jgi:hypothetical protein
MYFYSKRSFSDFIENLYITYRIINKNNKRIAQPPSRPSPILGEGEHGTDGFTRRSTNTSNGTDGFTRRSTNTTN